MAKRKEFDFKVVEIRESGATITHYLKGTKWEIRKGIFEMRKHAKRYEVFGLSGMIVWV